MTPLPQSALLSKLLLKGATISMSQFRSSFLIFADHRATDFTLSKICETATLILSHLSTVILTTKRFVGAESWEPKVAKIKHTRNENGQNFTHQNKTSLFWRKNVAVSQIFDRVKSVALWSANIRKLAKNHKSYWSTVLQLLSLLHLQLSDPQDTGRDRAGSSSNAIQLFVK
jgi:hypothetical protein